VRSRRNPYSRRQCDPFRSEAALCDVFIEKARAEGLVCHPETSGWDVLVVDPESGEQAGVEAKLRPNVHVLFQATRTLEHRPGPDVHAVLVPSATEAFSWVAEELRVTVLEGWRFIPEETRHAWRCHEPETARGVLFDRTPRWNHPRPEWEPEVEVFQSAGTPGPRSVTPWKIAAVKLCLRLRAEGSVRRHDVLNDRVLKASWSLWSQRWLVGIGKEGRHTLYGPRPGAELPDEMYPRLTEALVAAAQ
jgi:hypothetical protein